MSTASDRHGKKEDNQNHQNIAKDRYPQAFLCVEAASFISEELVILITNVLYLNLLYVVL